MAGKDKFCNTDFVNFEKNNLGRGDGNGRRGEDVTKISLSSFLKRMDVGAGADADSEDYKKKRAFMLEERARALAAHSKFYEATSLLEEIEYFDDETELGIKLLMAECYMQLGRENKASKAIKDIKKIVLSPPSVSVEDVLGLGEAFRSGSSFVRAMILFRIASGMIVDSTSMSANDKVDAIARCISLARKAVDAATETEKSSGEENEEGIGGILKNLLDPGILGMVSSEGALDPAKLLKKAKKSGSKESNSGRLRVIILDFGIEYMEEMLEDLRSVEGADPERLTLKEAWSTTHIGYHLANLGEFGKSYKIRKSGADAMEKRFGAQAGVYRVYGVLLHNMGVVLHNSQKYSEAEAVYLKALDAKEMALDYDDNEKQKDIEVTRKAVQNTRRHMK